MNQLKNVERNYRAYRTRIRNGNYCLDPTDALHYLERVARIALDAGSEFGKEWVAEVEAMIAAYERGEGLS